MSSEVTVALFNFIPAILWVLLVVVLIAIYYKPIRDDLIPRMGGLKLGPLEFTFIQQELQAAAEKRGAEISGIEGSRVLRRAQKVAQFIQGAQILWVDDHQDNNISLRRILRALGIFIDLAETSADALSMIPHKDYDAVISDMKRQEIPDEGQKFLAEMMKRNLELSRWTIFYVGDPRRVRPPEAFGLTTRPDELIHLVLDILERKSG